MRLHVMSDLHLEMHADEGAGFVRALEPRGADALVLAGDVTMAGEYAALERVFAPLAEKYRHVLYVPGNHEYYRSSPREVAENLARLGREIPRVRVLGNRTVEVEGRRFFGGTMWFPEDAGAGAASFHMNDFHLIDDFEPWVYRENDRFRMAAAAEVDRDVVVVSHHLPAPGSIHPRYARSPLNAFFLSDMTSIIERRRPPLWIHGHTHVRVDYVLGATRIVANPLGYPSEGESLMAFDPGFVIDV